MKTSRRFENALKTIPPPGGNGCHPTLLSVANTGRNEDRSKDDVFSAMRESIPPGTRRVSDQEIWLAIEKAYRNPPNGFRRGVWDSSRDYRFSQKPRFDGKVALQKIIERGCEIGTETDIWAASPIRLDWTPEEDAVRLLEILYDSDDFLFIGERYSGKKNVRRVSDWLSLFRNQNSSLPLIIPNPLTGEPGKTKDGSESWRCDDCVKDFRYCIVEFDNLPRADQLAFWAGIRLPIVALVDSGGKSIHAWIKIDCESPDEWTAEVEIRLFHHRLSRLGVDTACKNEARLSRLPGVFRNEKAKRQRLLYLAPGGKAIRHDKS